MQGYEPPFAFTPRFSGVDHGTCAKRKPTSCFNVEICILAGGLSKRMGRDKSRLRLGRTTMLGHIRKTARATGLPVRVIRRDLVPRLGPLGGIYTALTTAKAGTILFLACDMPLVTTELMEFVLQKFDSISLHPKSPLRRALFVRSRSRAGFPFILTRQAVQTVNQQIQKGDLSLQGLVNALKATILPLKSVWSRQLFNVNTPGELAAVKGLERSRATPRKAKR